MNAARFPAVVAASATGRILADNAAGTQLPDTALERMQRYLANDNAQKGAIFARTRATTALVEEAQAEVAALLGASPDQVGFGPNATTLALAFSRLLASRVQRGDRVVVTAADHEANVAPWLWLRRFGAQVDVVPVDARGDLDETRYAAYLARAPIVVALPWASNATGTVYDVARHARAARQAGALVAVDGVQAFPHFPLELDSSIDFATFSAYKCYGPHLGFWYVSRRMFGHVLSADDAHVPGGDARYWTLETGTQSYEAIAGWLGTVAYLRDVADTPRRALALIADEERKLSAYARKRFGARADEVRLYGRHAEQDRLPVFAFNVRGVASDELGRRLDEAGIEARVGDYYAPRLMAALTGDAGGLAVRVSLAHYNTTDDVDRIFEVIDGAMARTRRDVQSVSS